MTDGNQTGTEPTPVPPARLLEKRITFFGQPAKVACDGPLRTKLGAP